MKKSNLKSLKLNKKLVSKFNNGAIAGGKGLKTLMAEGCGTSVHAPMCNSQAHDCVVSPD